MVSKVHSTTLLGIEAIGVQIEAQIFSSLRRFSIVGLPDGALRESKDRVRCAIENSGFAFPPRELVVSLAPASIKKFGASFDLPIAVSILAADNQINRAMLQKRLILGELALDGTIKPVVGALAAACFAKNYGFREVLLPHENAHQAALIRDITVYPVQSLTETVAFLNNKLPLVPANISSGGQPTINASVTFGDVIGQYAAKRALEIVAAGGHNLLMLGPPGAGKSMLARRLTSILPPLSEEESIAVTKIYARFGKWGPRENVYQSLVIERPFRSPHHTTSTAGLIGGGSDPIPGEISLAHKGTLFLDEFPEFKRDALEALREPLETRQVTISRAQMHLSFPADFILVAAMNPCPCGYFGSQPGKCACSLGEVHRYRRKLSGPLLDRIDFHLWIPPLPTKDLVAGITDDPTDKMRHRVCIARELQTRRFGTSDMLNAKMQGKEMDCFCRTHHSAMRVLQQAAEKLKLSARGYARTLKVSRTIADLEESKEVLDIHIQEALAYRCQVGTCT